MNSLDEFGPSIEIKETEGNQMGIFIPRQPGRVLAERVDHIDIRPPGGIKQRMTFNGWRVRHEGGRCEMISDEEFRSRYFPVTTKAKKEFVKQFNPVGGLIQ